MVTTREYLSHDNYKVLTQIIENQKSTKDVAQELGVNYKIVLNIASQLDNQFVKKRKRDLHYRLTFCYEKMKCGVPIYALSDFKIAQPVIKQIEQKGDINDEQFVRKTLVRKLEQERLLHDRSVVMTGKKLKKYLSILQTASMLRPYIQATYHSHESLNIKKIARIMGKSQASVSKIKKDMQQCNTPLPQLSKEMRHTLEKNLDLCQRNIKLGPHIRAKSHLDLETMNVILKHYNPLLHHFETGVIYNEN